MELLSIWLVLWLAIALFVASIFLDRRAHYIAAAGWVLFGAFWFARLPVYLDENSAIKIALSLAALPAGVYVGYLVYLQRHDVLLKVSQMVAAMGLFYLPFVFVAPLNQLLIEHTAAQTFRIQSLLGIDVALQERDGLDKMLVVTNPATGEEWRTYIILACTGIGAASMFAGIIAAVDAPIRRKMQALAFAIPVIYLLNLVRNVFISTAYGHQWFSYGEPTVLNVVGGYEGYASFFWADKVISQGGAVVALVAILLVVSRILPEVMEVVDDVLEVFGLTPPAEAEPEAEAATDAEAKPSD